MANNCNKTFRDLINDGEVKFLGIASIVPMGAWNATTTYQKLNYVRHNGATYLAKTSSKNVEPGVAQNWQDVWMLCNYDGGLVVPDGTYPNLTAGRVVNALMWGSKSYDGSSPQTITAEDLGLANVYKLQGSIAFSALPNTPSADTYGYVWNITNDFTTDSRFIEGAGKQYFAGANVGVIEQNGTYYYDVLGNFIDTSTFVQIIQQTLTSEQQAQARANIGAAPTGNYALQDGTYAGMTVGNATNAGNDGEGNSIYDSYLGWWNIGTLKGNKATSQDFNDYTATGCYEILGSADSPAVNNPVSDSNPSSSDCNWYFLVFSRIGENFVTQMAFSTREDNAVAIRSMSNAVWGSWRLISEEGSAPTADKVANALTIRNQTGTGNILYNGSSALTIDLAPQTTNVYAEITAANMFAYVYAHIVMQRRGNKADIHMDFRIDLRGGNPIAEWTLFTTARLADVLGLSSLSFEQKNTRVIIENCPSSIFGTVGGNYAGYTGFMLAFDAISSGGIGIGRLYSQPSNNSVGAWEVTMTEIYNEDYIYHADIWGADVS